MCDYCVCDQALLDAGADPGLANTRGMTAVKCACVNGMPHTTQPGGGQLRLRRLD